MLDKKKSIFLKISGNPDPSIRLNVLEARVEDKNDLEIPIFEHEEKKYIIPLIESEELFETTTFLGKKEPGGYEIKLDATKYTPKIPQHISAELFSLSSENPVMQAIIDHIPRFSPKSNIYKYDDMPNDIPFYTYVKIRKDRNGIFMVEFWLIASSEDGGSSPSRIYNGQGRTADVEWICRQKINQDGEVFDRVFQTRGHKAAAMSSATPLEFHVSTENNNFSRGLRGNNIISLFPELDPSPLSGLASGNEFIRKYKALQALSYREIWREGRIRCDNHHMQYFVEKQLGGNDLITFDAPCPSDRRRVAD